MVYLVLRRVFETFYCKGEPFPTFLNNISRIMYDHTYLRPLCHHNIQEHFDVFVKGFQSRIENFTATFIANNTLICTNGKTKAHVG